MFHESSYGSVADGAQHLTNVQNYVAVDVRDGLKGNQDLSVRMAVPSHPMWHFVDEGEELELYVTFAEGVRGVEYRGGQSSSDQEIAYEVDLAGEKVPLKPIMCIKARHCTMFKATTVVKSSKSNALQSGQKVPFELQFIKEGDEAIYSKSEVTDPNMPVYYQPVWKRLIERDDSLLERINALEGINDQEEHVQDEAESSDSCALENRVLKGGRANLERSFSRSQTPVQIAKDDFFLYYTRKTCKPFFESQNPILKVVRELMVTPLTNFTGLSLFFQLYLVEIFHVKFFTKLGHYLCMPMVVLFMATWCAQWRFVGHYRIEDVSVFIVNGTMIFILLLQVWYLFWGSLYKMFLFGVFMVWPLFFMYMLSNMLFQIIVVKSYWLNYGNLTVADVKEVWGEESDHWYDVFTLAHFGVMWYLNPLLWAFVFACGQALSHAFEEKLPPRVSQTAHWLDLTHIFKQNGYVATGLIIVSQFVFGTINEFVASPRLLPLLILRICYNLGYKEKQWVKFRLLVEECLKFGDPAIDYIGSGGARWPKHFKEWAPDELESKINTIERGLTEQQKKQLKDPHCLRNEEQFTSELKYYVLLRHRLTKYKIQTNAYGPFTARECCQETRNDNDTWMDNDFPDNPAFRMFLEEARSHFAEMEYRFVQECKLNRVFL